MKTSTRIETPNHAPFIYSMMLKDMQKPVALHTHGHLGLTLHDAAENDPISMVLAAGEVFLRFGDVLYRHQDIILISGIPNREFPDYWDILKEQGVTDEGYYEAWASQATLTEGLVVNHPHFNRPDSYQVHSYFVGYGHLLMNPRFTKIHHLQKTSPRFNNGLLQDIYEKMAAPKGEETE